MITTLCDKTLSPLARPTRAYRRWRDALLRAAPECTPLTAHNTVCCHGKRSLAAFCSAASGRRLYLTVIFYHCDPLSFRLLLGERHRYSLALRLQARLNVHFRQLAQVKLVDGRGSSLVRTQCANVTQRGLKLGVS